MGLAIIAELGSTGADKVKLYRNIPQSMVYGDDSREPGNCAELLEYMLEGKKDADNNRSYDDDADNRERPFADKWNDLYERSKRDANVDIGFMALPEEGEPLLLALEKRITDYITTKNDSILKTATDQIDGKETKYHSIDLILDDLSTGGLYAR
jgi:hypothetical protein